MILLGLDLETTGLDTNTVEITEIGAVLYDWHGHFPLAIFNTLIIGPEVPKEVTALNGVTTEILQRWGVPLKQAMESLATLMLQCDYVVGHNIKGYDRPILIREAKTCGVMLPEKDYLDTRMDVDYPKKFVSRKLTHLAAEHGFVSPFPHRAVFDVMTTFQILLNYDITQVIAWALSPDITIRAIVSFEENQLAKNRGYHWDKDKKIWFRVIKEFQLDEERKAAPFEIIKV